MKSPHEVLGVPHDSDEAAIRARYLELVRQYPPDRDPQQFKEIRAAYDELRDPVHRLQRSILQPSADDSLQAITEEVRARSRHHRIPVDLLLSLGEG